MHAATVLLVLEMPARIGLGTAGAGIPTRHLLQFQLDQLKLYIGLVLLVALSLDRVRHVLAQRRGVRA